MYTIGADYIPSPSHAGGLRFHGMSSILSELYDQKMMEAIAVPQTEVFKAAEFFARTEGTLPAPESSHAILGAIKEAERCKRENREETILFGLTGTGYFDLKAYESYNNGTMSDSVPTDEDIAEALKKLP
jgi:tryptophan synthase beta chain